MFIPTQLMMSRTQQTTHTTAACFVFIERLKPAVAHYTLYVISAVNFCDLTGVRGTSQSMEISSSDCSVLQHLLHVHVGTTESAFGLSVCFHQMIKHTSSGCETRLRI